MLEVADGDDDLYEALDDELRRTLRLPIWCYPTLADKDEPNPYPVGTAGHQWHPLAQRLRSRLHQATKTERKAR
jgi:hypothetical protein